MIVSTHARNERARFIDDPVHVVVDVRHVPDRPVTRAERRQRKRLQAWLDGIRFDRQKARLLELAARAGAGR